MHGYKQIFGAGASLWHLDKKGRSHRGGLSYITICYLKFLCHKQTNKCPMSCQWPLIEVYKRSKTQKDGWRIYPWKKLYPGQFRYPALTHKCASLFLVFPICIAHSVQFNPLFTVSYHLLIFSFASNAHLSWWRCVRVSNNLDPTETTRDSQQFSLSSVSI